MPTLVIGCIILELLAARELLKTSGPPILGRYLPQNPRTTNEGGPIDKTIQNPNDTISDN